MAAIQGRQRIGDKQLGVLFTAARSAGGANGAA